MDDDDIIGVIAVILFGIVAFMAFLGIVNP